MGVARVEGTLEFDVARPFITYAITVPTTSRWITKERRLEMSVYAIAQGRIEDKEMLDQYLSQVIPTILAGGGRIVAFAESPEVVEGEVAYPRTVIVEFESREAFRAWYDSDDYQAILPLRLDSTPGTLIVVDALA